MALVELDDPASVSETTPLVNRTVNVVYRRVNVALRSEKEKRETATKLSIYMMIFLSFLSNTVYSIVIPSLPLFLVNVGAQPWMNGFCIAANSAGTFIASPLLGWWSDKRGVKEVIVVTTVVLALANIWYGLSTDVFQITAARFVVGLAAGNSASAASFLSYATSAEDRAGIITLNMAFSVLGFIAGPGFSAITSLDALRFDFQIYGYTINVNAATSPGFLSAMFALLALPLMIPFKNIAPPKQKKKPSIWEYFDKETGANLAGVLIIFLSTFLVTIAFTVFETSGPLYVSQDELIKFSVFQTSLMFGALALNALVSMGILRLIMMFYKNERILLPFFSTFVTIGLGVIFDWQLGWVTLTRFCIGVWFISFGFTINQSLTVVVFSKILDGLEQGVMMGWMGSVSAVARMVAPIVAGFMWKLNQNWVILLAALATFVSNVAIAGGYRALQPRKFVEETSDEDQPGSASRGTQHIVA